METVRLQELSLEGIGMKVYAIIECHYDDYYPNHIVLDGSAYLYEEDAK